MSTKLLFLLFLSCLMINFATCHPRYYSSEESNSPSNENNEPEYGPRESESGTMNILEFLTKIAQVLVPAGVWK
ncbi:unnamed protein product [Ceutorhynchus assimilis]|uniref:Uncharacterized protein n=1 Tax=Ceutorhynchus assimilis TaxID=467358 RepID=A0A9N9MWH6_9CUCU|nr:unnamed protein product [Ceutorhynchus assimilis]